LHRYYKPGGGFNAKNCVRLSHSVTEILIIEVGVKSGFLRYAFFGRKNIENSTSHIYQIFMGKAPVGRLFENVVSFILRNSVRPQQPFESGQTSDFLKNGPIWGRGTGHF
jgi:hypothetical protein